MTGDCVTGAETDAAETVAAAVAYIRLAHSQRWAVGVAAVLACNR